MKYCMGDFGMAIDWDAVNRVRTRTDYNVPDQDTLKLFNLVDGKIASTKEEVKPIQDTQITNNTEVELDLDAEVEEIENMIDLGAAVVGVGIIALGYFLISK